MPTTPTHVFTNQKLEPYQDPQDAHLNTVSFTPGAPTAYAKGTVVGQVTATGHFGLYADAGAGGLDVAKGLLAYDINVLANGRVVFTNSVGQTTGEHGETYAGAPVYYSGTFRTNDLVGLTAAAVTDLGALTAGDLTNGIIRIG